MLCQAVTGEGCHPLPSRATPIAEPGAGEAAVTVLGTGVKPVAPSSGPGEAEPLHFQVSAQPSIPLLRAEIIFTGLQQLAMNKEAQVRKFINRSANSLSITSSIFLMRLDQGSEI